jgi:hypothetical protein
MTELRIGDSDREAAVSALGEHYAAGRLTKEEYDERADAAWSARTSSQLAPLFADLPRPSAPRPVSSPTPQRAVPVPRYGTGRWCGAGFPPVLLVVLALVILTHVPVFLLFVVAWFVFARIGRHRGYHHGGYRRDAWQHGRR